MDGPRATHAHLLAKQWEFAERLWEILHVQLQAISHLPSSHSLKSDLSRLSTLSTKIFHSKELATLLNAKLLSLKDMA